MENATTTAIVQAITKNDFNSFYKAVNPLLDFTYADECHAPEAQDTLLKALLAEFCDPDAAYEDNHLNILEAPDPYFLCDYVYYHCEDGAIPDDYDDWGWEYIGGVRECKALSGTGDDALDTEHAELIEKLYDKYADECRESQQKEWLEAIFSDIKDAFTSSSSFFEDEDLDSASAAVLKQLADAIEEQED